MLKRVMTVSMVALLVGGLMPAANAHVQQIKDSSGDTGYAPLDLEGASFKETKKSFTLTLKLPAPLPPADAVPEGNAYMAMGWSWGFDFNDDIFYDVFLYSDGHEWQSYATRYEWPDGQEMPDYQDIPAKVSNKSNKVFKVVIARKDVSEAKKGDTVLWSAYSGYGQANDAEAPCWDELLVQPEPEPETAPRFKALQDSEEEEPEYQYGCWDWAPDHESASHKLK